MQTCMSLRILAVIIVAVLKFLSFVFRANISHMPRNVNEHVILIKLISILYFAVLEHGKLLEFARDAQPICPFVVVSMVFCRVLHDFT